MARQAEVTAPADRPPYVLPSMRAVRRVPSNGLNVVSTFSGCGGSCLGFRMAGFRTVWASEFVPAAAETYRANFPGVPLDVRDIRQVTAAEIRAASLLDDGREVDVLEGSPPCASFSMSGRRERHWGEVRPYSDVKQRVDDLFDQYVRLVGELRPRAFVAENVSGLVRGVAIGVYRELMAALRALGYDVASRVLDAQWLDVPQRRQRLIIIGVRADVGRPPAFPRPRPWRYSMRDALPGFGDRAGVVKRGGWKDGDRHSADGPAPTVQAHGIAGSGPHQVRIDQPGAWDDGKTFPIDGPAPTIQAAGVSGARPESARLERYAIGAEARHLRPGEQSAKYHNLIRANADAPCPTITQTAGNPGAAGVIHPTEARKFTIPELRALCGFPPDFILTGTEQQQWERLGRAVPPPMMRAIAETLRDEVLS